VRFKSINKFVLLQHCYKWIDIDLYNRTKVDRTHAAEMLLEKPMNLCGIETC
jgi:hypothetical protein